jgi:ketosteroid isomerase-like protein
VDSDVEHGPEVFTEGDDLALYTVKWTILGPISLNLPMNRTNYRATILRKQPDGNWRIAADNPVGPDLPPVPDPVTVL